MDKIIYRECDDKMMQAYEDARSTFKYFYRELMWDQRRYVSALQNANVKVLFIDGEDSEHMWIDNIVFDGKYIHGILTNSPRNLRNIKQGDKVSVLKDEITDWLFVIDNVAYGAFTIQVLRSEMNAIERYNHDKAWGIDLSKQLVAYDQENNPSVLIEHPMAINCKEHYQQLVDNNKEFLNKIDEYGNTLLHLEAYAGNKTMIEILVKKLDLNVKNKLNQTPYDVALMMGWDHIVDILKG